jgi:hypothetical protein
MRPAPELPAPLHGGEGIIDDRVRRFAGKVVLAAASFALAVAVGLESANVWTASPNQKAALAVTAAFLALVTSATAAVHDFQSRKSAAQRAKVAFLLEALGFGVQDATGVDYRDLGLAAYVVERQSLRLRKRLVRLHRVRPRTSPGVSGVVWTPGKGVIGMCVLEGRDIGFDVSDLDARLAGVTREEWPSLPPDARLGLSFDEWERLRDKFGVIVATPIVRERAGRSRAIGCVSLDGPAGQLDLLFSEEVRAQLQSAATGVERVVL